MWEDYLPKASAAIGKSHAVVSREDLQVKDMTYSAGGTVGENPGSKVKGKSGLTGPYVIRAGGELRRQFGYRSMWQGEC